jgi:hypothetical protein
MCVLSLFFQICLVSATFEVHKAEIVVDEKGSCFVRNMFFIDSTNTPSFFLPLFSGKNIRAYDEEEDLNYSLKEDSVYVFLKKRKGGYSFNVEYSTDVFTSKNRSEWMFSYDFYKLRDFDSMGLTLSLPTNSVIYSFSPDGVVYSDEGRIKIDWDIPRYSPVTKIQVRYGFKEPQNPETKFDWFPVLFPTFVAILIVCVILVLFLTKRPKKLKIAQVIKKPKEFSPGQKDIMKTLTENEKRIVEELLTEEKGSTQKKLSLVTGIPKATLSRTLRKLESKQIIEIKMYGNTNLILLTKWFLER